MRRKLLLAAAGVAVLAGAQLVPAGAAPAGIPPGTTSNIVVRVTATGPSTSGFSVSVACTSVPPLMFTLNFDVAGVPTTMTGGGPWSIVNGTWKLAADGPEQVETCSVNETNAGGAQATSWTCGFEAAVLLPNPPGGCSAAGASGAGPIDLTINGTISNQVQTQTATIEFINTFPEAAPAAEPVTATPTFTG